MMGHLLLSMKQVPASPFVFCLNKLRRIKNNNKNKKGGLMVDMNDVSRRMDASVVSLSNDFSGLRAGERQPQCLTL